MISKSSQPTPKLPDPSTIPAFDRAMRGLIQVPKSEIPTTKPKSAKRKK